jgi:tetratricopeptide (TPR) repeat protein
VATKRPGPPGPPEHAPAAAPALTRNRWLILALLAGATFAVFAGVLRDGWTLFDDPHYVFDNPHVNRGFRLDQALWFLAHPHGENWHPLTSWSHQLDVTLFGLAPAGHHAVSLLLHALNAALLAWVLYRLTGAWWRSVVVAALFALHPLRVESVAWISERKDVLSGLFFVLSLAAYRRWAERPGAARQALLIGVFGLGLMAKPMLVTLPFVLVLLDVWPLGRLRGRPRNVGYRAPTRPLWGLVAEKWPLLGLSLASAVITFLVQRRGGAVASVESVAPAQRVANALLAFWRYVGMSAWPRGLCPFYPSHPAAPGLVVAAVAGLAAVTWVFVSQGRRRPYLLVGWLWYLGMLVPVIGLIQVGSQAYADRYTYLPTIGLLVALMWFVGERVAGSPIGRWVAAGACGLALAGMSLATVRQVGYWKDTATLFGHALAVTRDNPVAHVCLGDVLMKEGKVRLALPHYEAGVRLAPGLAEAHNKLGAALGALGRADDAIAQFQEALRIAQTAEIHHNLGFAYARQGRQEMAIEEFQAALRLDPDHFLSLVHLGAALGALGRSAESEAPLRHALELKPADFDARRLLAVSLTVQGRVDEAIRAYGEILNRAPDDLDALNNVAWMRATCADPRLRDGAEAVRLAERARDQSPEPQAVLYSTLAAAYAEAGRFTEAVSAGQRAVELAQGTGETQAAQSFQRQLERYRAGRPFHFGD